MTPAKQRPISISSSDRAVLDSQKQRFEQRTGERTNWGSFLATVALLGLAAAGVYYFVRATRRSPQAVDVQCSQCHGTFQMAVHQGSDRAIYTTCSGCGAELVVYLETQH